MKIRPLLTHIDSQDFLSDYLAQCGVKDVDEYLHADLSICDSPWDYPNMMSGVERMKKAIDNGEHIIFIQDPDGDGMASTAIGYNFIKFVNPDQHIDILIHEGKEHGIAVGKDEDMLKQVIDSGATLLICPDAASNDAQQCMELREHGIDVLILDHHEITTPANGDNVILINHHLEPERLNTDLSGAGVTFKWVQACAETWGVDIGNLYYDLVACSLATDSCSMLAPENYALTKHGFAHITNPMVQAMCEEFNTKGNCPEGVSWGLGPRVNATIRGGSMEDKRKLMMAFVDEGDIDEAIKIASELHKLQSKTSTNLANQIHKTVDYKHKVLVGFSDNENKNYSGLVANKFMSKFGKPTLILRPLNSTTWSGSLRSPVDIADKMNDTGLVKCQGHLSACGLYLKKSNLDKLVEWFDNTDLDMTPCKDVVASLEPKDITVGLCRDCQQNPLIWGKDTPKPIFYIKLRTNPSTVNFCGKTGRVARIPLSNGLTFIKFTSKAEDRETLQSQDCDLEMVVSLEVNEWNDHEYPQGKIEEWEITPVMKDEVEDWRDLF